MSPLASNPQVEALPNQEVVRFTCRLCDRDFDTTIGRSQHMRHVHIEEYNASINVERVKPRWAKEEVEIMGYEEAQAVITGLSVNMNQFLSTKIAHRTVEGIKGKRRTADYKAIVNKYVNEALQTVDANETGGNIEQDFVDIANQTNSFNEALDKSIAESVEALSKERKPYNEDLIAVATMIRNGIEPPGNCLSKWLKRLYPHSKYPKGPIYNRCNEIVGTSKMKRRQEYAIIQKLYKKDFGSAARRVLATGEDVLSMPSKNEVVDFWKAIFEHEAGDDNSNLDEMSVEVGLGKNSPIDILNDLWKPILEDEILASELAHKSAPGPDGISSGSWKKLSPKTRVLFYNTLLRCGSLGKDMKNTRTVLIPKGSGIVTPTNTRPLSITSVVVRQLHRILALRLKSLTSFDKSQKAFIDCDGTMENLSIVSTILQDARMARKEVHIAILDLRKAFDSVTHSTIIETVESLGCPKPFCEYIKNLYIDACTTLQYDGSKTCIKIKRGVLQGDPLSPLLFNAVMDRAIKSIPQHVGYNVNGNTFNCIAYADDIIIVGSTKLGLQLAIDAFAKALASFGLEINEDKSSTLSMIPSGKEKKIKVIVEPCFKVNNNMLEAIGPTMLWKYLGIRFVGSGMNDSEDLGCSMSHMLKKVDKAPLKPQQRLQILKTCVIPKYMHMLVLGRTAKYKLKYIDNTIRRFVRKWLRFPNDIPIAYMYASVSAGGLGIPKLSEQVPLVKMSRLEKFVNKDVETSRVFKQSLYIQRQLSWCKENLAHLGSNITKDSKNNEWRKRLLKMVDTNDLAEAKHSKASNDWVSSRSLDISGDDYIKYHHIRAGCLPSRSRTSRGRRLNRCCRAGCRVSETNHHVIQVCHRTHGGRVLRHDRLVEMLSKHFNNRDRYKALVEPIFKTSVGNRKPDLLLTREGKTYVLDVQVVNGSSINRDYVAKKNKYKDIQGLEELIKKKCASRTIEYDAITISYKGVVERNTYKLFQTLNIGEHLIFMLITSVLRGSWLNWNQFNKTTALAR